MKITFRTLEALIGRMTEQQKDHVVMADIVDGINSRTTSAMLAVNDDESNEGLDLGQPYLLIESPEFHQNLASNIEAICARIGL
jgi:hypothetical protein